MAFGTLASRFRRAAPLSVSILVFLEWPLGREALGSGDGP